MTNFKIILQNNDLKATHQRLVILQELEKSGHIDIDTLYSLVIASCQTLSKATLYRNLNDLIAKNIVTELKAVNQKKIYEIAKKPHIHLVCKKCNTIIDEDINTSTIFDKVLKHNDFHLETTSISLFGICKNCFS
jgi:Fe2+ or Zn2+ uptake regulation protein